MRGVCPALGSNHAGKKTASQRKCLTVPLSHKAGTATRPAVLYTVADESLPNREPWATHATLENSIQG